MIPEFNKFAGNKILGWLLMNPDANIGINELARELAASPATVMRYSNIFSGSGLVTIEKAGTAHLIRLNNERAVVIELKKCAVILLLNDYGICDIAGEVVSIALYGSAASGKFTGASDLDILVIGEESQVDRDKVLEIQEKIGREIQLTVIPWHKFERMKKENDPFIRSVIEDHILLSGAEL
ncbi:nucleotidyltransferase domain-containing protein [Methanolacinia paynteri]|uniref:nucleotidyltransferase domain-containing protein n=1 Tax=Methanolacinia paynteri TaxID=230356 RepID=UPI00064F0149|nr:nucleotidyltransferase domain-containing protein [Methanolacinia paynteri]